MISNMIIEVNTKILDEFPGVNMNQLVFLSMILGKNQPKYQDVRSVISLISDEEISYLVEQGLITSIERDDSITYQPTDKLTEAVLPKKDYFDVFYDMYPVYVMRSDGTKSYLRANVNKCRHFFNTKCGKSSAMAEHLIKCLDFEISKRMREGSLSYMMTMWNWLTRSQWEAVEEEMADSSKVTNTYGTELI
jgi:hypothetical protein